MSFWAWVFSLGRTAGSPAKRSGGGLPLAPVRRAQLDITDVDAPAGAVRLADGDWRAVARVTGFPATLAGLRRWAEHLNALPGSVVMLARSRPGGLEEYAAERIARAALPDHRGTPLAWLLTDQAHHAVARTEAGHVRRSDDYVVVRAGTAPAAQGLLRETLGRFAGAGVRATAVTDGALAAIIASSWRPVAVEHFHRDLLGPDGEDFATLHWTTQRTARVSIPRYVAAPAGPPAPVSRKRDTAPGKQVATGRPARKALPR